MNNDLSAQNITASGGMTLDELRAAVDAGAIDTIVMAAPDMQGRLQGKRVMPRFFLDNVLADASEGCNYLLAVDVEMTPVSGYDFASWDRGYGDFVFRPDLSTLRRAAWQEGAAIVLCDIALHDGTPAPVAPRSILRRQLDRLAAAGLTALAATELEFMLFRNTYEECMRRGYRDLDPANLYNVDYSILGTAKVEKVIRAIRNALEASGIRVENSKGECNLGQHEINFAYATALEAADGHVIYKEAAKEIAQAQDHAITYMAKFNERRAIPATSISACATPRTARSLLPVRATRRNSAISSPASPPTPPSFPSCSRPTSTPTSATPWAASRRPAWSGGMTTAPAPSACSATGGRCASRTGCRAAT
ncbi:Glutamine synthetase, catalytic region [Acidiphilium sp. PM]|nr:Glutamine synthetase, catalytic region [Acidiphilium sp. PM]